MSSLANVILFLALVGTSLCVVLMYRKLKQFENHQAEYRKAFEDSIAALGSAGDAVRTFATDGRVTLDELSARIDEAKSLASQLETFSPGSRGDLGTA